MKLTVAFVLLLLLSCGGRAYQPTGMGAPQKAASYSRSNLVTPMDSWKYIGPEPVAKRWRCSGFVSSRGRCFGTLNKPSTGFKKCYGSVEGGVCSGPVF